MLAKAATLRPDDQLKEAAIAAGRFLEREILPKSLFQDFEVFYSCAPKPLHWVDPLNGIPPINNLAIQWSADHFLALFKLTEEQHHGRRQGLFSESLMHGEPHTHQGSGGGWTGFNWGPGGGLGASAYLDIYFGSVWIDGRAKRAVPIDGVSAEITSWQKDSIVMKIENAMSDLPLPFTEARKLTVKFGHMPLASYTVEINGQEFKNSTRQQLADGVEAEG